MRMNVTITTDASYCSRDKVGGYAFQIKSNGGTIKRFGPLKGEIQTPTEAEMKAILNALHIVKNDIKGVSILTINTDNLFFVDKVIKIDTKKSRKRLKVTKDTLELLRKEISEIVCKKVQINHVRAHVQVTDNRTFVNDWCDTHARLGRIKALQIKKKGAQVTI